MNVLNLYRALDARYPISLSCSWDNDGLMICPDPEREVKRVLFALDATEATISEAVRIGADVLITHHPMLFRPLKTLTPLTLSGSRSLTALAGSLAVMSFHTRLDAADGGVNDALCARIGLIDPEKFGDDESPELGRIVSLPVPMAAEAFAQRVRDALGAPSVRLTGARTVSRIAVVGGDGKDFITPALLCGADTLLTGDASYNTVLDAAEEGLNVIEAGHYYTEAPVLDVLAREVHALTGAECSFANSNLTCEI